MDSSSRESRDCNEKVYEVGVGGGGGGGGRERFRGEAR